MAASGPNGWIDIYSHSPGDGIDHLPDVPRIYALYDRTNGKFYVGCARDSILKRGRGHRNDIRRGWSSNPLIRRILSEGGKFDFFIFTLLEYPRTDDVMWIHQLHEFELAWTIHLHAHDEERGYNQEAGHIRTPAWRLRECELRLGPNRFSYLPGIRPHHPIRRVLVDSWMMGIRKPNPLPGTSRP